MRRHRGWVIAGALAVLAVVASVTVLPPLLVGSADTLATAERLTAQNEVRGALLQALGALFLAAGLFFTARTFDLNRQGQITERFTRSVDQLGHRDAVDVRVGGVFALERLAKESPVDRLPIIEILTAFVRQRSPWPPQSSRSKVPADVQAAVLVLGRLAQLHRTWEGEPWFLDLADLDLRGGRFDVLTLPWADLRGTRFDGATLAYADLTHARLHRASFENARFGLVVLDEAWYSPETTRWPDRFDPEEAGAEAVPDDVEMETRLKRALGGRPRRPRDA